MQVKVGGLYTYTPFGFDVFAPTAGNTLERDQIVRVINLPSAPPANSMTQCYVADPHTCKFICMVGTVSLTPLRNVAPDLVAKINRKARHESRGYGKCACGKRFAEDTKFPPYHRNSYTEGGF